MHNATDSLADPEDGNLKNILSKEGRKSTHRITLFENQKYWWTLPLPLKIKLSGGTPL
jgi:hypothetical protein